LRKIAVIFGGPSPEHDVSILTGLQAARELQRSNSEVVTIYWSKSGDLFRVAPTLEGKDLVNGVPSGAEPIELTAGTGGGFRPAKKSLLAKTAMLHVGVAIVCCHGGPGEDGTLQGALDVAGIPYTGPGVTSAALGMDKLAFGGVAAGAGLPVLPRMLLVESTTSVPFDGPYIVKPRFGGSSIGIEVVDTVQTAAALVRSSPHLRAGAVIEPYRPDSYDLNVAVRLFPQPELSAIEKPMRSATTSGDILGYADKYVGGEGMVSAPRELPAVLPEAVTKSIQTMALEIAQLCDVRGVQRIDFLADGDDVFVNEINTIPGSLAKHLWVEPTVPFATLLEDMVREATQRPSRRWTSSGADGTALQAAGAISGKLG